MCIAEQKFYDAIQVNTLAICNCVYIFIISYVLEHLVDFCTLLYQLYAFLLLRFNKQLLCLQNLIRSRQVADLEMLRIHVRP